MEQTLRNTTDEEAAIMLRLAKEGVPAYDLDRRVANEINSVKPFNVRASCGHVVIRKMREATAGVAYTPDVILEAPNGRACPACEGSEA